MISFGLMRTLRSRRLRGFCLAALTTLLITACAWPPLESGVAEGIVSRYLELLSQGRDDRGWSLLHPDVRRYMFNSDEASYLKAAELSGWEVAQWRVSRVEREERGLYQITVEFPQGSMPSFLLKARNNYWLLSSVPGSTAGQMMVRFDFVGAGVFFYGG